MSDAEILTELKMKMAEVRERAGFNQSELARCEKRSDGTDLFHRKTINTYESLTLDKQKTPSRELVNFYERNCNVHDGALMAIYDRLRTSTSKAVSGLTRRRPYQGTHVRLQVLPTDKADHFTCRFERTTYTDIGKSQRYLYAICETNALMNHVDKTVPIVNGATFKTDATSLDDMAIGATRHSYVSARTGGAGKLVDRRSFVILPDADRDQILGGYIEEKSLPHVRLLAADLTGLGPPYTIVIEQTLLLVPRLYFWDAEQRTFCHSITIDLSALGAASYVTSRTNSFLPAPSGHRADLADGPIDGVHTLSVEDWIEVGHGFVVYWTPSSQYS